MTNEEAEQVWRILSDWPNQVADILLSVMKPFIDIFRQAYRRAGMPYGDTEEGFTRWLEELERRIPDYRR